jgi:hypothetical protein
VPALLGKGQPQGVAPTQNSLEKCRDGVSSSFYSQSSIPIFPLDKRFREDMFYLTNRKNRRAKIPEKPSPRPKRGKKGGVNETL